MKYYLKIGLVICFCVFAGFVEAQNIAINAANFPDTNFRNYVQTLPGAEDGEFTPTEIYNITVINVPNKNIASLKGVEFFTNVMYV
jgi:hypothetical protein